MCRFYRSSMSNSKAYKKHFASLNLETAELNLIRNDVPCIFRPYKKHLLLTHSYNPNY
jgi:hypothetical protein